MLVQKRVTPVEIIGTESPFMQGWLNMYFSNYVILATCIILYRTIIQLISYNMHINYTQLHT